MLSLNKKSITEGFSKYLKITLTAAIINLFFSLFSGLILGGRADGHVIKGHYFLNHHGKYTEVSEKLYICIYFHQGFSSFLLVAALIWMLLEKTIIIIKQKNNMSKK